MSTDSQELRLPVRTDKSTPRMVALFFVVAGLFMYAWGVYQLRLEGRAPRPLPSRQPPTEKHDSILLVRSIERTYHRIGTEQR